MDEPKDRREYEFEFKICTVDYTGCDGACPWLRYAGDIHGYGCRLFNVLLPQRTGGKVIRCMSCINFVRSLEAN